MDTGERFKVKSIGKDAWRVTEHLGDGWQATGEVTIIDDQPVLVRVTIEPSGDVPAGGLRTRKARSIHPDAMLRAISRVHYVNLQDTALRMSDSLGSAA